MRGGVTDAGQTTNNRTVNIELLSQWKLEAEFRNNMIIVQDNDDDDKAASNCQREHHPQ